MTYAGPLGVGDGSYPWEHLRWELALSLKKPACASMIAQKPYGIYTLVPIFLSAGTLKYTYQILPGYWRPVRGGLPVLVRALGLKSYAGEILRLR